MARAKSPEKRKAILDATVRVIARQGLSAPTATIAKEAAVAEGSLFTYFLNKEDLLNQLYIELKQEAYARVNASFPQPISSSRPASVERRAQHVWDTYIAWGIEFPDKQRATQLLGASNLITPATREQAGQGRSDVDRLLAEIASKGHLRGLSQDFVPTLMLSMQEAIMQLVARRPRERKRHIEAGFQAFWRAVK